MKLYLDDIRNPPKGWLRVASAEEAIVLLQKYVIEAISFDYDLGECKNTGYDVAKWIERQVFLRGFNPPQMCIHSMNPVGREKIQMCIDRIMKEQSK